LMVSESRAPSVMNLSNGTCPQFALPSNLRGDARLDICFGIDLEHLTDEFSH
jgi:hypothetical protein